MAKRAQNNKGSAPKKIVGRPFEKGKSGNPGGRPAGLMQYVREQTKDGKELVDFALKILRGAPMPGRVTGETSMANTVTRETVFPSIDDQMDALRWLADRGFGKPVQEFKSDGTIGGLIFFPVEDPNA